MVLTLMMVRLGSISANSFVEQRFELCRAGISVTSMMPPMKCERSSIFFIRSFL